MSVRLLCLVFVRLCGWLVVLGRCCARPFVSVEECSCTGSTCQIQPGFVPSADNGATWTAPVTLSAPTQLGWIAPTSQGAMVGDYIATSFLAGQQRAIGLFAAATAPTSAGVFNEPMFAALEDVGGGTIPATESPAVITGTSNTSNSAF